MNDPSTTTSSLSHPADPGTDIEEQRTWLNEHKQQQVLSWRDIAQLTEIPEGTVSQFGGKTYQGRELPLAEKVVKYRRTLAAQSQLKMEMPEIPGYFETETSRRLENLLRRGQTGRIVVAAMGAGLGKTMTARHYRDCYSNVFLATMSPSTAGVNNMQIEVLEALGERDASGTPQKLSRRIRERAGNARGALIIIDEAQHLSEKALEEVRSWHDAVGVGIALLGNASVWQRLTGGSRQAHFAQMFSRLGLKMLDQRPMDGDVTAMAAAWNVGDPATVAYLRKIVMTPGGLRGGTFALEIAAMIAISQEREMVVGDLQRAWTQLSSMPVLA